MLDFEEFKKLECFEGFSSDAPDQELLEKIIPWLRAPTGTLLLHGGVGCGKTHAALWALKNLRLRTPWVRAITPSRYITLAFKGEDVISSFGDCQLLLFDDLGTQGDNRAIESQLFELFNRRYSRRLPTLVTSNLDIAGMESAISQRVVSRMKPIADVAMQGRDLRGFFQ